MNGFFQTLSVLIAQHAALRQRVTMQNIFCLSLIIAVVFAGDVTQAQQPAKVPPIGYLGSFIASSRHEAFRQGLRELGYVEGKNIVVEWRDAEGKLDRLPALAAELVLVRLKVAVIVTAGG